MDFFPISIRSFLFVVLSLPLLLSCGSSEPEDEDLDTTIHYYLDRTGTGLKENFLIIESDAAVGYKYRIEGEGFEASVPKGTILTVEQRTRLSYSSEGTYTLKITIFHKDESILLTDSLSWEYNTEQPAEVVVSFDKAATNTETVQLFVASNRADNVNHIHIVGDVHADQKTEDNWYELPKHGLFNLKLTDGDGLKSFAVKLRNEYYNETKVTDLEVIKKTTKPEACQAIPISPYSANDQIEFYIAAEDPYPLSYMISGEGTKGHGFREFSESVTPFITMKNGEGEREIIVTIKDIADNYCDIVTHVITVDYDYQSTDLGVVDSLLWTDDANIILLPHFDHFPHIVTEMYIDGGVVASDKTFQWIPIEEQVDIELLPSSGHRGVDVSYRDARGSEDEASYQIFLKPFLIVKGVQPSYTLLLSPIHALESIKIIGCDEDYDAIDFSFSLPCTSTASEIVAEYTLSDQSVIRIEKSL